MRRFFAASLIAIALVGCASTPGGTVAGASAPLPIAPVAAETKPALLADLVKSVDIPFESFKLDNGLTVLVHTDRKAPLVGVTAYYRVGSKSEPKGRTGFAHLFEHLMFGGSENVPNFDVPLEAAGSTSTNGSTWYDRTNYVETLPVGALDLALMMESDRMGHLLGAISQDKLDKQRGVVQNEKRQGDNDSYGLDQYAIGDGLFPVGHPYRHSAIGSMADLEAASLIDVRKWFTDNYGPNNVVLALAGDIDAATARPMVEKWFGHIPRGPEVRKVDAGPVTLPAPVRREMTDQVPVTRLYRAWSGPDINHPDAQALGVAMQVLGGLASSRLDNALVRGQQLAVSVSANAQQHEQLSVLQVRMDIKPGVDRALAERKFDELIADYIANGPSEGEMRRAATVFVSGQLNALEQIGGFEGKGAQLAEGQLYSGDPMAFRQRLDRIAALTPDQVKAALQRWLSRPVYALAVSPGERTEKGELMGGWGDEATAPSPKPDAKTPAPSVQTGPKRALPPTAAVGELTFPGAERTTLSNGIAVTLARRTTAPTVLVSLDFDAGFAADATDGPGTQSLLMDMLDEGTSTRSATAIAEQQELLGAWLNAGASIDTSTVTLSALSANLAPSLALMADVVRNPAFAPDDVARVKEKQLADIAQAVASPGALARRNLAPLLYGPAHPYGQSGDGLGDAASVSALTPERLRTAQARWMRPDMAQITVVGDITMAQLRPLLDAAFGQWTPNASPRPTKAFDAAIPAPRPRIVLIDRPNSPQSVIVAGRVLPLTGRDHDKEALDLANEVLGNGFLSRLNLDLREEKSWSYGVRSSISSPIGPRTLALYAPVQSDRTGDSIRLLIDHMRAFPTKRPVDDQEFARVTDGNVRGLPNRFETNSQVLGALISNQRLGRPDDYQATLPSRYRAIDKAGLNAAAQQWLHPDGLIFLVVGDRKVVEEQLTGLGLPVEVAPAVDSADKSGK